MDNDDTRLGEGDKGVKLYFDDNDGDSMWEKFVRKHKNIFLVMSGHVCTPAKTEVRHQLHRTGLLTSKGDHGNDVHQICDTKAAPTEATASPPNAFHPGENESRSKPIPIQR